MSQEPYIDKHITKHFVSRAYNPEYGDERICNCGHPYYRHFDTYDEMEPIGCKYCGCYRFVERGPIELGAGWQDATPLAEYDI